MVTTSFLSRTTGRPKRHLKKMAARDIPIVLCIPSSFSRQIVNRNAGPSSPLESMGAKRHSDKQTNKLSFMVLP